MSLGDVIKESRLRKNIKQSDLAEQVGVTVQTYIKWETNETEPKASQVAKLSQILGISTDAICYGEENKKMELTAFMRLFSRIQKKASDFEVALTVWENVNNDMNFIEAMRKNAGLEFNYKYFNIDEENGEVLFFDENNRRVYDPLDN